MIEHKGSLQAHLSCGGNRMAYQPPLTVRPMSPMDFLSAERIAEQNARKQGELSDMVVPKSISVAGLQMCYDQYRSHSLFGAYQGCKLMAFAIIEKVIADIETLEIKEGSEDLNAGAALLQHIKKMLLDKPLYLVVRKNSDLWSLAESEGFRPSKVFPGFFKEETDDPEDTPQTEDGHQMLYLPPVTVTLPPIHTWPSCMRSQLFIHWP